MRPAPAWAGLGHCGRFAALLIVSITPEQFAAPLAAASVYSQVGRQTMTLSYVLDGAGWAIATIAHEGQRLEMRVSRLHDTLRYMTEAAIGLKEGARSGRFCLADEPGYHECIVTQSRSSNARVRVLWGENWFAAPGEPRITKEVFVCSCSMVQFCLEAAACLQRLLDDHGLKRYKVGWGEHDFPLEKFERLHRLLFGRRVTHTKRPRSSAFAKDSRTRRKERVRSDGWRSGVRARIAAGLPCPQNIPKRSAKVPRRFIRPIERGWWSESYRFGYAVGSEA